MRENKDQERPEHDCEGNSNASETSWDQETRRAQTAIAGLRLAMHMRSAEIAPQTDETIEAMREAVDVIKYLQAKLSGD
jgi:hypothetical protein